MHAAAYLGSRHALERFASRSIRHCRIPFLFAYSAGIYVLLHSNIGSRVDTLREQHLEQRAGERLEYPEQCAGFDVLKHTLKDALGFPEGVRLAYYSEILFVLFNSAFTGDTHTECLLYLVHPGLAWFAWLLTFTFLIITLVLLLNMLIAMMAKTFDNVWEASQAEAQYLFARLVFYQAQRAPEPPPLNTLRAPSLLASWVLGLLVHNFPNRDPERPRRLDRMYTIVRSSFQFNTHIDHTSARAINLVKAGECDSKGEEMVNEYKGTTIGGTVRRTRPQPIFPRAPCLLDDLLRWPCFVCRAWRRLATRGIAGSAVWPRSSCASRCSAT